MNGPVLAFAFALVLADGRPLRGRPRLARVARGTHAGAERGRARHGGHAGASHAPAADRQRSGAGAHAARRRRTAAPHVPRAAARRSRLQSRPRAHRDREPAARRRTDGSAGRGLLRPAARGGPAMPGVKRAALASVVPLNGGDSDANFAIEGRPRRRQRADTPVAWYRLGQRDYFSVMGIRLLDGACSGARSHAGGRDQRGHGEEVLAGPEPDRPQHLRASPDRRGSPMIGVVERRQDARTRRARTASKCTRRTGRCPEIGINVVLKTAGDPAGARAAAQGDGEADRSRASPVSGIASMKQIVGRFQRHAALLRDDGGHLRRDCADAGGRRHLRRHVVCRGAADVGNGRATGARRRRSARCSAWYWRQAASDTPRACRRGARGVRRRPLRCGSSCSACSRATWRPSP